MHRFTTLAKKHEGTTTRESREVRTTNAGYPRGYHYKSSLFGFLLSLPERVQRAVTPTTLCAITNPVNTSFSANTFARAWKLAEVIPLVKSGDADEPSNTRPISLLPFMSKVCEGAAHSQFANFLDQNENIAKLQNGNRKLHSTETA